MPKCKLKPWKLNEPQIVWESQGKDKRILVSVDSSGPLMKIQQSSEDGYTWKRVSDVAWDFLMFEAFINLLGIPETTEEEEDENL